MLRTRFVILTIGGTLALVAPGAALASLQSSRSLECVVWGDGAATAVPTKTINHGKTRHAIAPALATGHYQAQRNPI